MGLLKQIPKGKILKLAWLTAAYTIACSQVTWAQDPWKRLEAKPSTLGLEQGYTLLKTPQFALTLVKASQTVAALKPANDTSFDFTPSAHLKIRSSNRLYHLGDIDLRTRAEGETAWVTYSTASNRAPVTPLPVSGNMVLSLPSSSKSRIPVANASKLARWVSP